MDLQIPIGLEFTILALSGDANAFGPGTPFNNLLLCDYPGQSFLFPGPLIAQDLLGPSAFRSQVPRGRDHWEIIW